MMVTLADERSGSAQPFRLHVLSIDRESEGTLLVRLGAVDQALLPHWTPGAHIDLILPNGLMRQYSLCGCRDDRQSWTIVVQKEPAGRGGSVYVHEHLVAGDELVVAGPRNNFPLVESDAYLFIAGGIGITPILPMIAEVSRKCRRWTLVYGGRSLRSMALLNAIATYEDGEIHLIPFDELGPIDLAKFLGRPEPGTKVYCCGPGQLIDAVKSFCASWPPAALHRERFAPKYLEACADSGAFEVELARSGRVVCVSPDQSLLGALEDAGYCITNSCRAGICGTCLLTVLDGTPEHRDDLLDDAQREAGKMILPCVSRSKTLRLVLEL
jgi:ferredoxin-NADP reductase